MNWKEFAKKVSPSLLSEEENISLLGFNYEREKYRIVSQWGSGKKREEVNLWAKKEKGISTQIYPFDSKMVDKLKFHRRKK